MKNILKIILFLFMLQLSSLGLMFSRLPLLALALVNLIFLICWMLLDDDFSLLSDLYRKKIKKILLGYDEEHEYNDFFALISYFVKHFLFSVSFLILIFVSINDFIFKIFDMSIWRAIFWFAVFSVLNIKNILSNDIFLLNKRLFVRDFLFLISIFLFVFMMFYLGGSERWYKICVSLIVAGFFYMIFYGFFGVGKVRRFFSDRILKLYLFFDMLAIIAIAFFNIDYINSFFVKEVEKEIIKTDVINVPQYVCSGSESTGESLVSISTGENLTGDDLTGQILSGNTAKSQDSTGNIITGNQDASTVFDLPSSQILTYKELIPFLVKKYNLKKINSTEVAFSYIPKNSVYYNDFLIAYQHRLFGKTSNPEAKLRCENLIVLVGLIKGWKLEYTSSNIFDVFWAESLKQGLAQKTKCKSQTSVLTNQNLNF